MSDSSIHWRPVIGSLSAAAIGGFVIAVASRPPAVTCADPAAESGGALEIVVAALIILLAVIFVLSGAIVTGLGRATVGIALLAAAGGLVLAIVADAFVARPARCDYHSLIEYGTVRLVIDAPLQIREDGPGVCLNMRRADPSAPQVSSNFGPDWKDAVEVEYFSVSDPSGANIVTIQLAFGDDPTWAIYSGSGRSVAAGTVRFDSLPLVDGDPRAPLSGTISWTCPGEP